MKILISSRSEAALRALKARIPQCGSHETESVLMLNGHVDPLMVVDYRPDVLVLHAGDQAAGALRALAERPARDRPALVVVGDQLPTEAMKLAMRAGARDFIGEQELTESLRRLEAELRCDDSPGQAQTIAVVNAKGGSGGTFIATSLAHLSATVSGDETVVVDLDFQYGPLPHYLDLQPKRGLLEALAQAHELDEMAVQAYSVAHESGLHVMAPLPEVQSPVDFNVAERMTSLVEVLKRRYGRVIIDLPRHLDEVAAAVLQASDEVVIVLQQSLLSVRDAVRLKTVLTRELAVPEARISNVVNRYGKNATLQIGDIRGALDEDDLVLVPNQYKLVSQALDMGVPVFEQAPNSAVAKALVGLQGRLMGRKAPQSRGFLAKTVFRLRG
jgi:pilus assembly protein CpaE